MELRGILAALRRGWWLQLLGLVVGGALAALICLLQTPLYTSSTQFFVSTTDTASTTAVYQGSQFSENRVTSYAQLLSGNDIAGRVARRLNLRLPPEQLAQEISATAGIGTVLVDVKVTDPSPDRAQKIAEALGTEFTSYAAQLEATNSSGISPVKVTVTQTPDLPTAPSSPKTVRNVALGLLIGLVLGSVIAVVRARMDRSVRDPDEAAELAQAPVIGTVLKDDGLEKRHTVDRAGSDRTAEDYRQLRTNLQFLRVDEPPKVIMVSSALPAEGKTTLVINLALALAEVGKRVTIVEADLRRPKVTRYLGMVSGVGLTNVLVGTAEVEDVVQTYRDGMSVIASGPNPPNPGELLASSHMATVIEKLRNENDFVLVDAPPLLPVADSSGLAVHTDGVLLSVKHGSTRKEELGRAVATLERVGTATLGVVLNIVPPKADAVSAYGYGYSYGVEKVDEEVAR